MSVMLTCRKHPNYQALHAPRRTNKYPEGCPGCNLIYGAVTTAGDFAFVQTSGSTRARARARAREQERAL